MVTGVVMAAAALVITALVLILVFVVQRGSHALTGHFFTQTLAAVGPLDPAKAGGAANALVGSLEQVAIATALTVPLGVMTAVYLNEVGGRASNVVRFFVDAMSGIPSIVAGLFVFTVWVVDLHKGFSGIAAAFALGILMLPTVTRTCEEVLKLVPGGLREASAALAAPEWKTAFLVVLPAARAGLVTAVILGVARVAGETAPLLLTAFGNSATNANPLHGAQSSLPLFVYQQVRSPVHAQIDRAWVGALVLLVTVLIFFVAARLVSAPRIRGRNA